MFLLLKNIRRPNARKSSGIKLLDSGPWFFEVQEELIRSARKELYFQIYRIDMDETGRATLDAMKEAATKGVEVYLMVDAYGSGNLPRELEQEMEEAGIQFKYFSPVFSLKGLFFGRRLHHKIVVADGKRALVGGINTADKYRGVDGEPPWLDFAVYLEGEICEELVEVCQQLFGRVLSIRRWLDKPVKELPTAEHPIQLIHNDWFRRNNQVYNAYLREVKRAEKSIVLMASYFLPGSRFRKAIIAAADRGVRVKMIFPGRSDIPYMKYAATYLYDLLFRHGIEIYEWDQSILHGKAMIVDSRWCTLGSFNLINLSIYGSIETNVEVVEPGFVACFVEKMDGILQKSVYIDPDNYKKTKKWTTQFRNRFYYYFIRRVFAIMTFFSYRKWKNEMYRMWIGDEEQE